MENCSPVATYSLSPPATSLLTRLGILLVAGMTVLLGGCGGPVDSLIRQLSDADPNVREAAAKALEKMGPPAKPAVPALAAALHDSESNVRFHAAKALSKIGADAAAVPALADALKDKNPEVRYYAVKSLAEIGPDADAESAVPVLVEVLQDKSSNKSHYYAIKSLRHIGPKAVSAVPVLKVALHHNDAKIRKAAAAALKNIEDK